MRIKKDEDGNYPRSEKATVYISICIMSNVRSWIGEISIDTFNRESINHCGSDKYEVIDSFEIDVKLPDLSDIDLKGKIIEQLEKQKQKELAEHHVRMKQFQDQIDNLLAIEHKPDS